LNVSVSDLSIQEVVVVAIALAAKGGPIDVLRAVTEKALETIRLGQRLLAGAPLPVVDHGGLVIHRHPDVAATEGRRSRATRADLMKRHDEMISTDVHLGLAERPDAAYWNP